MRLIQAFATAIVGLMTASGAFAQDSEFATQVRAYLDGGAAQHSVLGYAPEPAVPDLVTPIRLDRPYLWPIELRAGVNYRIYGACDNDCADLDMEIYGEDGYLADRDTARDDRPYVQITPVRSGRHYVRLWLYACRAEPCYVGARVMSGGRLAERMLPGPERAP